MMAWAWTIIQRLLKILVNNIKKLGDFLRKPESVLEDSSIFILFF